MAVGVYVPLLALVILIAVFFAVLLVKGIDFFKNVVEVVITAVFALMISYLIMLGTMPDLFIDLIEPWRGLALSFVNTAFGTPIALVLYYPMKKFLGLLRWTKVLGGGK